MDDIEISEKWNRNEFIHSRMYDSSMSWWDAAYWIGLAILAWRQGEYLLTLGVGTVLYLFLTLIFKPTLLWNSLRGLSEPLVTKISEDGISVTNGSVTVFEEWSTFSKSIEKPDFYILRKRGREPYSAFRKRAFVSRADEARFRALLRSHTQSSLREDPLLD